MAQQNARRRVHTYDFLVGDCDVICGRGRGYRSYNGKTLPDDGESAICRFLWLSVLCCVGLEHPFPRKKLSLWCALPTHFLDECDMDINHDGFTDMQCHNELDDGIIVTHFPQNDKTLHGGF